MRLKWHTLYGHIHLKSCWSLFYIIVSCFRMYCFRYWLNSILHQHFLNFCPKNFVAIPGRRESVPNSHISFSQLKYVSSSTFIIIWLLTLISLWWFDIEIKVKFLLWYRKFCKISHITIFIKTYILFHFKVNFILNWMLLTFSIKLIVLFPTKSKVIHHLNYNLLTHLK